MPSHQCIACGAEVSDHDLWSGQAKRDNDGVYCVECSSLIEEPEEESAKTQRRVRSSSRGSNSGRRTAGQPRRTSARKGGSSARQPAARASQRAGSSGRNPRASARDAAPRASTRRRASAKSVEPASRASSRSSAGASRRASAKRVEPAGRPSASSRRLKAAVADRQDVEYGTARVRPTRASRRGTSEARGGLSSRGTAQNQGSNITVIGIISAGLVVIGLVALLASSSATPTKAKSNQTREEYSAREYVEMASQQERMKNWLKAKEYWQRAAESWEKMGQSEEAVRCNMRAADIGKSMRLQDF